VERIKRAMLTGSGGISYFFGRLYTVLLRISYSLMYVDGG